MSITPTVALTKCLRYIFIACKRGGGGALQLYNEGFVFYDMVQCIQYDLATIPFSGGRGCINLEAGGRGGGRRRVKKLLGGG